MSPLEEKVLEMATDDQGQWMVRSQDRGQIATIIAVVTVAIVAIIGVLIYSQVKSSVATPDDAALVNATDSIDDGFADAMQLVPVVLLILVASLVISVVQKFG